MKTINLLLAATMLAGCATTSTPAEAKRRTTAPSIRILDATASEDNTFITFTLTRSSADGTSSVKYRTIDGSALAVSDYDAESGTVSWAPGELSQTIAIRLYRSAAAEPTERFSIRLRDPINGRLADSTAIGTIIDSADPVTPPEETEEPPPVAEEPTTKVCTDGSVIPVAEDCPAPPAPTTKICPDGTVIPVANTCPVPAPSPHTQNIVTVEGDSISNAGSGHYPNLYDAARSSVSICQLAVGGSDIGAVQARIGSVQTCNGEVVTLLIGANDMYNGQLSVTWEQWLAKVWAYTDSLRSDGYKVAIGTILPQCCINGTAYITEFTRRRPLVNAAIRAAVGTHVDAVFDLAADSRFGDDADARDTTKFPDGLHPSPTVHQQMMEVYAPVVDALLAQGSTTPAPSPGPDNTRDPLLGLADIVSNFDFNLSLLTGGGIPSSGAPDVVGAFRFICGAGKIGYIDPIVNPGGVSTHLHQFYGNDSVVAGSTYSTLRGAGSSTCNQDAAGNYSTNRSAYWMPAMLDGKGNVVKPDYVTIYYKRRPASDPVVSNPSHAQYMGIATDLPNGLKFIFGFDMLTSLPATGLLKYNCDGTGAIPGNYANLAQVVGKCPAGARLGAIIEAPQCWDGKNLDSANHRDHMAYASYGSWGYLKCPTSHPYVIPTFLLGAWYKVQTGDNLSLWSLSSDAMFPSVPKGTTFHADFFMAWDPQVKAIWHQNCINLLLNCSGGQLGNGQYLKGAGTPYYNGVASWSNPSPRVPVPGS